MIQDMTIEEAIEALQKLQSEGASYVTIWVDGKWGVVTDIDFGDDPGDAQITGRTL